MVARAAISAVINIIERRLRLDACLGAQILPILFFFIYNSLLFIPFLLECLSILCFINPCRDLKDVPHISQVNDWVMASSSIFAAIVPKWHSLWVLLIGYKALRIIFIIKIYISNKYTSNIVGIHKSSQFDLWKLLLIPGTSIHLPWEPLRHLIIKWFTLQFPPN